MDKKRKLEPRDLAIMSYYDRKARGLCTCNNPISLRCTCEGRPAYYSDWQFIKDLFRYAFYLFIVTWIGIVFFYLTDKEFRDRVRNPPETIPLTGPNTPKSKHDLEVDKMKAEQAEKIKRLFGE